MEQGKADIPKKLLLQNEMLELQKLIDQVSVVSFDFFDTLFTRPLAHPEDIFTIIAEQFAISDFVARRRTAQAKAFQQMLKEGRKEINLTDIYNCFEKTAVPNADLMQAEYNLELSLLEPIPEMFDIFISLLEAPNKKVVIISDMYLTTDFFIEVLKKHQVKNVDLFVSADCNATKRDSGELFEFAITELNILPKDILHIGDNLLADVTRPEEKGLYAFHYQDKLKRKEQRDNPLSLSISSGLLYTRARETAPDSCVALGFRYGGPMLVGFFNWIKERANADNIDHILFISRDGFSLNNIANLLSDKKLPEYSYFLSSRTSLTLASITADNFEQYIPFLLSGTNNLQPRELLERIGVNPPSPKIMSDLGLGSDIKITPSLSKELTDFLYAYRWEILKVCKSNRYALFNYLKEMGLKDGKKIALVDVGWSGSTQVAFEKAISTLLNIDVTGYYFCLAPTPECINNQTTQKMIPMISSDVADKSTINNLYDYRVVIESFFSAPHATVIGLNYDGKHNIQAMFDTGRGESKENLRITTDISNGVSAYTKCYSEITDKFGVNLSPLQFVTPIFELCNENNKDLEILSEMVNFDAWGSSRNHQFIFKDYLK